MQSYLLSFLLLVCSLSSMGQGHYYWTPQGKVYLMEDHERLFLEYDHAVAHPLQMDNLSRATAPKILPQASNSFFVEFSADPGHSKESLIREFGIKTEGLRHMAWGMISDEGIPLFLASKVLYAPNQDFDPQRFDRLLDKYRGVSKGQTGGGLQYVEVKEMDDLLPLANELYESGMFIYAHPDMYLDMSLNSPTGVSQVADCTTPPEDSLFRFQYYLENDGTTDYFNYPYQAARRDIDIDGPEAWCLTTGDTGIVVAVVDQGVESHEELFNDSLLDRPSRILPGYSTITTLPVQSVSGEPSADSIEHGHGQAVAGIIAASHNGIGLRGIAPQVKILPVHVNIYFSSASEFADGIMWAWKNGADIINNSWTFNFCTSNDNFFPAIKNAIDSATIRGRNGRGSLVVFASGDARDGTQGTTCMHYPSELSNVLSVGAISANGQLPNYARFGPNLDLVGVSSPDSNLNNISILDRMGDLGYNTSSTTTLNHGNKNYSMWFGGTSASSAMVSGVAALVLSTNPDLSYTGVRDILTQNTTLVDGQAFSNRFGYGIVNAEQAVLAAQNTLPVEWLSVDGKQIGEDIHLSWATASEQNNDRFVIEKQMGSTYRQLGSLKGAGNSTQVSTYTFKDSNPLPGTQVYRIKQVDIDGKFSFSPLVEVFFESEVFLGAASLQDALAGQIEVQVFNLNNRTVELDLMNIQGQKLAKWQLKPGSDRESMTLPMPGLSSGIYLLRMRQTGRTLATEKLILR